tara:strand:- start:284 stop:532 length:249 start_codon:yes stop_codon:yes gene_type:complete
MALTGIHKPEVLEPVVVVVVAVVLTLVVQEQLVKEMMVVMALRRGLTSVVVVAEDLEQLEPMQSWEDQMDKLVLEVLEHQTQ